ncbi:MAG: amidohydrolase family protein [Verrucomicrobia bacterium]|nr:amidohydrolase family protein [Verrucomicrobiota bacterium]
MKIEPPIIDAHALLGAEYHLKLDPVELLRRMDAHMVETAIARPMGAELAVFNTEGNNRVLKAHPRIRGMAAANPWFGGKAIEELKRCRDLGAVGLFLHPSRQGFMPTDDLVRPLLDFAVEAGWPVMFHTGSYVQSDILALGEVARKYPGLNFIAGFGGFTDMWFELPGLFAEAPNLYLDASVMWSDAIEQIVRERGESRVLFGSAEPRNCYAAGLKMFERLDVNDQQMRAILSANAKRIFRLP